MSLLSLPRSGWFGAMVIALTVSTHSVLARPSGAQAPRRIDFNREIRPILAENCFTCHGPDKNKRKAGLRLDRALEATSKLESGERAVVPHDPEKSRLLKVVVSQDPDEQMPPKKTGKRLTREQVQLLREWIVQGAPWKEHWAYLAPERPALPPVKEKGWPRNEIDYFVLARLEHEKLRPQPEAQRHTLIRRATVDLTGLPPTIAEVDAFLADKSPKAYEKVVDRLLASPAYGERMAQHWLDLARYADSDGYHADAPRSMWQYRDYVINSFNANKPFNQFTLEQIAGDLLDKPTVEQRIATAFNRNGMSSTEGGADPDEYMNKYVTDRVNTFGTVYLGSSIACTECHDHKYDQFTQKEYYQLYDFFNRIPERGLDSDPAPPFVKVPTPEQTGELARLTNEIAALELQRRGLIDRKDEALDDAETKWEAGYRLRLRSGWTTFPPTRATSAGRATMKILPDASVVVGGALPPKDTYEVTFQVTNHPITSVRLEALNHESLPLKGSGRGTNGGFLLTGVEVLAESLAPGLEPSATAGLEWGVWSALGPFKAADPKEVFSKAFINESEHEPAKTYEDGRLRWVEKADWKDGVVKPLAGENQVSYFHRSITVKTPRYLTLKLGSDGGMQVWVNGARQENGRIYRGTAPDPDAVVVWLRPGENQLLLKVHQGSGTYGFFFQASDLPVTERAVELATAVADHSNKDNPVQSAIDDKADTGWAIDALDEKSRRDHQAIFAFRNPVGFEAGTAFKVRLKFESGRTQQVMGCFRLAVGSSTGWEEISALPPAIQTALFAVPGELGATQKAGLREYYRDNFGAEVKAVNAKLAETRKTERDLYGKIPTIRVMEEMPEPRPTHIRVRGDYRNRGQQVWADVPKSLPPLPRMGTTNRLALAKWLIDPRHPLVSRVTVNRYWALYFGTGLVKTGNEFGSQGELPSHPELLDWLAREFMDTGWNVKALQKKILMSATYRQASKATPELLAKDPNNRLLARGPRYRMTAEMIRDCALDYAGLLDRQRKPGGPSVKPYQPAGLWEEKMFGGNKYEESKGADLYRRTLYTLWKRTVLNPTLMTFDAPDRAICTEQRSMTCTPLQAFVTLNEKGFVEAARVMAQRILVSGGSDFEHRLTFAYKTVLARVPTPAERKIMARVHADMLATYQKDLKSALDLISTGEARRVENVDELDLVAWTAVANVLLNLDETVTKE